LTPVPLRNSKGEATGEMLTEDDHRRPQTTMEGLANFVQHWEEWTVTAGTPAASSMARQQ